MSSLSLYLPPFASDYTGAASALFELDCLVAINDGSCCTSHFASYDEPRWNTDRKQTLCTNLRMNDTVFGIDERIVEQLGHAARDLEAKRIVALGTPVPAVIGTDMEGLASELEAATGIPSFGLNTTGFSTYVSGICKAFDLTLELSRRAPANKRDSFVNVLGATPIDISLQKADQIFRLLADENIPIGVCLFMGTREQDLGLIPYASCNLAVTYAGLLMAQKLQKMFGTPYVSCGFISPQETSEALSRMRTFLGGETASNSSCVPPSPQKTQQSHETKSVLIVGDQVIANSLRRKMQEDLPGGLSITVASFFGLSAEEAYPGDVVIPTENHLVKHLRERHYDIVAGDPLLKRVPDVPHEGFISLVHPAVSSRLFRD